MYAFKPQQKKSMIQIQEKTTNILDNLQNITAKT